MNPTLKRIIFVIGFVLVTLVLPAFVLLLLVDSATNFGVYVITYGVIIFGVLGYIVYSIRDVQKKIDTTMDEIKMQNAAIAYRLSNNGDELSRTPYQPVEAQKSEPVVQSTATDTVNIPLNPAEPLVMPVAKKVTKVSDDGFDDFK